MKTSLFTFLAIFMMFLGTAYAEVTPTAPFYLNDDGYLLTEETDFTAIDSTVFSSYAKCIDPADMSDTWYCSQTPGCPMCEMLKQDAPKSSMDEFVPQVEEQKWIEEDPGGWYS